MSLHEPIGGDPHGKGSPDHKPDRPLRLVTDSGSPFDPEINERAVRAQLEQTKLSDAAETPKKDWRLDEQTIEVGRRGIAQARAELAAAEERARLREETPAPPVEPEDPNLDPERPF